MKLNTGRFRVTREYDPIIFAWLTIIALITTIVYIFYFPPVFYSVPNIFRAPIETVPFDGGWMGFAFIFVNGFLLSNILVRDRVGITERLLLSAGLGFGVTYLMMILIGILWEISLFTVILTQVSIFIALLLAAINRGLRLDFNGHLKKSYVPKFNPFESILLIVIGIFVIVAIYQTVAYPTVDWDTLAYGVNYAKIIFKAGKIPLIAGPSIGLEMSASYPPGVQSLAVYLYTFAGIANDFYFRILQPIFGLATILATYKFAMILTKNRTVAVFAIFTLSIMSTFWLLFVLETYLMCLTLMLMLSALFFFKAYKSNDADAKKYEIVGTIFCGFATLTSYIGLFSFGILLLYSINRRLPSKRFSWLVLLASILVLPWYMRNLLLLGNPIFPFFGIGNYLDPLLLSSSMQHFQNWSNVPFNDLYSTICKIGAGLLFLGIVDLTFIKRKQFFLITPFYLLLVALLIMGVHIPFVRYLIIALPASAVIIAASTRSLFTAYTLVRRSTAIILISMVLISSAIVLPCINSFKPTPTRGDDKWSYIQFFEEGDAWKWINENTPIDARIATYDIKQYYIERDIFMLDGNEAVPLYKMDTIEECIDFLEESNVTFVLSVPWASPSDTRMPPAYKWCTLTRYLGDPSYLPPVYVGLNGTAVYHVGLIEEETCYAAFTQKDLVPPIKHLTVNVSITNSTGPPSGRFYIPIPVDYREGLMMVSINSSEHSVCTELWTEKVPETITEPSGLSELWKQWPISSGNRSGVKNPSFTWGPIYKWGYFTFLILDQEETFTESYNVSVDIKFYNYWDIEALYVSEGLQSYNITTFNETFPVIKTLYIQANEPYSLTINSDSANKKISIEIFNDFLPTNAAINWSAQYDLVRSQPNLTDSLGEVGPSIQNLILSHGRYSILIVYRDSYTEQLDISLEIRLTSWSGS